MATDILNIDALAIHDDSIIKKEFYPYTPYTTTFGESDEIRIAIQSKDSYLLPCESYIYMQITATTTGAHVPATDQEIRFVNNFASFLFSEVRYQLNDVTVDHLRSVGRASTMKLMAASRLSHLYGYASICKAFESTSPRSSEEKKFDIIVPLSVWFGFCDDYQRVILNCKHELILNRARQSLDCTVGGGTAATSAVVKIALTKIEWKMPHITLSDGVKLNMLNYLSRNRKIVIQHRSMDLMEYPELPQTTSLLWSVRTISNLTKPRFVLVGLQTNRNGVKNANAAAFDMCEVSEMRLHLNSQIYPYHMNTLNIEDGLFMELYNAYSKIQQSYYNGMESKNPFALTCPSFQNAVIFAFDTSRADESLIGGSIDVRLEIKTRKNIPANTSAYCVIIYDNEFTYSPFESIVVRNI